MTSMIRQLIGGSTDRQGYLEIGKEDVEMLGGEDFENYLADAADRSRKSHLVRNIALIGGVLLLLSIGFMTVGRDWSRNQLGHSSTKLGFAGCHRECDDACSYWNVRMTGL